MNIAEDASWFNSALEWIRGLSWIEQGLLATFVAIAAFAAGWKQVLYFYRWCWAKYDEKILHLLQEAVRDARMKHRGDNVVMVPISLTAIASAAKRSQKSTYRSLRKLESDGIVKEHRDGWTLTSF